MSLTARVDWLLLDSQLKEAFAQPFWTVRLNPSSSSFVVHRCSVGTSSVHHNLNFVYQRVVQVLAAQGVKVSEVPLSPAEVVPPRSNRDSPFFQVLHSLANAVSVTISLSTFLVSLIVFTVGFVGLFLPFSPGIWLLIVATFLLELAISLRRPFLA